MSIGRNQTPSSVHSSGRLITDPPEQQLDKSDRSMVKACWYT